MVHRTESAWLRVMAAAAVMAASGCTTSIFQPSDPAPSMQLLGPDGKPRLTQAELAAMLRAACDKYVAVVNQAITEMIAATSDPRARVIAQRRRLGTASSVYAIAGTPNPEIGLLDLAVLVTVEREIIVRGDVQEAFGPLTTMLTNAYDKVDGDVWGLVRRVFTGDQVDELTDAIERWLTDNADLRDASFIRVDDFARLRSESTLSQVGRPGGLTMLAPINEATRAADDIRLLGERALFLVQRMPQIVRWQGELLVGEALDDPRAATALERLGGLNNGIDSLSGSIRGLPAEIAGLRAETIEEIEKVYARQQEATLKAIDERLTPLRDLLADSRRAIADADGLAARLSAAAGDARGSIDALERLSKRLVASESESGVGDAGGPPSIRAYLASIDTLSRAAEQLSASLAATERLLTSGEVKRQTDAVNALAEARISQITRAGVIVIVAFFGSLTAYRLLTARARRTASPASAV